MQQPSSNRLPSIDVIRALTMLLMIFVNDLWTLSDVPVWLEHASAHEDRLGFADTIFPAFLFIVGLSIPLAIAGRIQRNESKATIVKHIGVRSLALLIIGVFHVNLESYHTASALLPKPAWEIFITIGFFFIWLDYSKGMNTTRRIVLQSVGVLILIIMAFLYKGGTPAEPEWMRFHWWGILGLIGWSYLICAVLYVVVKDSLPVHIILMLAFIAFCSLEATGLLQFLQPVRNYVWLVGDGSMPALVMAGIVISLCYRKLVNGKGIAMFSMWAIAFAVVMLAFGYLTRPIWGINKISATPSWTTVCIGFTTLVFVGLVWLVDRKGKENWFAVIRPAGTSTLTAYLLPYIHYPIYSMIGISLPLVLRTGGVGIVKCLLYALAIVVVTGWLEKRKVRLRL